MATTIVPAPSQCLDETLHECSQLHGCFRRSEQPATAPPLRSCGRMTLKARLRNALLHPVAGIALPDLQLSLSDRDATDGHRKAGRSITLWPIIWASTCGGICTGPAAGACCAPWPDFSESSDGGFGASDGVCGFGGMLALGVSAALCNK